jgi:metallo-beta-lactamase class B
MNRTTVAAWRHTVAAMLLAIASAACARTDAASGIPPEWTTPVAPFRIFGNTWYVGSRGLAAILITSPAGHVLIDGDLPTSPPLIEASIRALGFRVEDVKYILNSHAHYDHAGGIAALQRAAQATVVASADGAAAIERGHGDRGDPQFESAAYFPPAHDVRRIGDGDTLRVGDVAITAHLTPGHTPGSTSWTWRSCADGRCLSIAYADSLTAVSDTDYRFSDDRAHPGIADAFRRSIATVSALPCDILLTPHPGASDFWARHDAATDGSGLVDASACRRYGDESMQRFDERVARERATQTP